MAKNIYVNLPVKDIEKTRKFFSNLGFTFNKKFSNEKALCLIIGENIFSMLLQEDFFKTFIPNRDICNTEKTTEVLVAIDVPSKEEVDSIVEKVKRNGGKEVREAQDHGWMYSRAFQDLDGHIWEVLFTDESKLPEEMRNRGDD
jgi:uncharacterized protein